jgi:diguanylate cyclase (GGDEF)-like protein/PAS domain S-box-containing protein
LKISGFNEKELLGKSHNIARDPNMPKSLFEDMWRTIKQEKVWIGEIRNLTKNGDPYWLRATIEPYYENGKHVGFNSVREDIRFQKELESLNKTLEDKVKERTLELERQLYVDSLTNLGSYYALTHDINKCQSSFPVLMLLNIDNFQNINNLYGYESGNDVLKEFAKCLSSFIKDDKYKAYRLFADEFVIFQNCQYADIDDFYEDLLVLKDAISKQKFYIKPINDYLNLDVTAGISIGQENPMGTVDMALRYAKKHKLSFQAYHSELNSQSSLQNTIEWKKRIKDAIEENRVIPVFQPIVNRNQEVIKYEVLIRIKSEDNQKLISPQEFLEEAINAKQYNNLMKIVFEKTFEVIRGSDKLFSINISYSDIFNNTLIKYLKEEFEKDKQIASQIVIEILETQEIEDSELMNNFINEFREYGVRIAIDDFGVGHSNLAHILKVNPDYLKIDGEFIKNINEDKQSYAMVTSIIAFCKKLDIKVIAEYVHSKEVFDTLYELGIDEYQGFYFSPPKMEI